jgi:hypothetical protein
MLQTMKHVPAKIIRASAAEAIRLVVRNGKILPKHKNELISIMLWKITEAEGKYRLRFQSAGALTCKQANQLRHEHVFTRKQLTHELLQHPRAIKRILAKCLACVVTRAEHAKLNRVTSAVQGSRPIDEQFLAGLVFLAQHHVAVNSEKDRF